MGIEPEQVLEQQRVAAARGIEDAEVQGAFEDHQHQRDRDHRRPQHLDDAGGVVRPDEQRQRDPGHARGAHAVDGDDEIQSGQDRGESRDEDGQPGLDHLGVAEGGAEGRVEGPARVHAAGQHAVQHQDAGDDVQIPAQQIDAREGQVLGADHQRDQEIAQHGGDGWDQEEEHHHLAVHGEELVVGVGLHQVARRSQQFQPDQQGEKSSDEKEESDGQQVEQRDALVVDRKQPGLDAVFLVEIILAFRGDCCGGHCYCTLVSCGFAPDGTTVGPPAAPDGLGFNDFTYATSAFSCSSLTSPWKTGMMGLNPLTIFAPGVRMDSRM